MPNITAATSSTESCPLAETASLVKYSPSPKKGLVGKPFPEERKSLMTVSPVANTMGTQEDYHQGGEKASLQETTQTNHSKKSPKGFLTETRLFSSNREA